ncbi:hypothetical protein AB0L88_33135 [Saccharopolyspora shandongensis]|uniref:hypothetical protein n=1 Tax=Saccharopolyspora shandongensis TaxID=418495 RepID=UPI003437A4F6
MEAHDAYGLLAHNRIERYLRDAYHTVAPAGTDDVQRLRLSNSRWVGNRENAVVATTVAHSFGTPRRKPDNRPPARSSTRRMVIRNRT